jgi:hypothetical protein
MAHQRVQATPYSAPDPRRYESVIQNQSAMIFICRNFESLSDLLPKYQIGHISMPCDFEILHSVILGPKRPEGMLQDFADPGINKDIPF